MKRTPHENASSALVLTRFPASNVLRIGRSFWRGHFEKSSHGVDDLPRLVAVRGASKTIPRIREQLKLRAKREEMWKLMSNPSERSDSFHARSVHGTLRDPLNEYLFPESIYDRTKMDSIGALVNRLRLLRTLSYCRNRFVQSSKRLGISASERT